MSRSRRQHRRHPGRLADRRAGPLRLGTARVRLGLASTRVLSMPRAARIRSACARNRNCRSNRRRPGYRPLADRMRPRTLAEFTGQAHLLAPGRPLHRLLTEGVAALDGALGPAGQRQDDARPARGPRLQGAFHRAVGGGRGRQGHPRGGRGGAGGTAFRRPRRRCCSSTRCTASTRRSRTRSCRSSRTARSSSSARRPRTRRSSSTRRCCRGRASTC